MKYEDLQKLNELREKGIITEEEYIKEKEKILNEPTKEVATTTKKPLFGLEENVYLMLMHITQFAGIFILPGLGYLIPIFMWFSNKDTNENVDKHGKNIINFTISYVIYGAIGGLLSIIGIGLLILFAIGILWFVVVIIASMNAYKGEYYKYPFIIEFLK